MRISTVREFRDHASVLLKSTEPVLITRRGRMAGVFFPSPEGSLPVDLKRELFDKLSAEIAKQIGRSGGTEEEVLADFESWRITRHAGFGRRTRSRR
jgi:hypothetical protein